MRMHVYVCMPIGGLCDWLASRCLLCTESQLLRGASDHPGRVEAVTTEL